MSAMEQKLAHLQEKTQYLSKENNELKSKITKGDDKDKGGNRQS